MGSPRAYPEVTDHTDIYTRAYTGVEGVSSKVVMVLSFLNSSLNARDGRQITVFCPTITQGTIFYKDLAKESYLLRLEEGKPGNHVH